MAPVVPLLVIASGGVGGEFEAVRNEGNHCQILSKKSAQASLCQAINTFVNTRHSENESKHADIVYVSIFVHLHAERYACRCGQKF